MAFDSSAQILAWQFIGLLWIAEFNAARATTVPSDPAGTVYAINCTLASYAALEALIQETAAILVPDLYRDRKRFLREGLAVKFEQFLEQDRRGGTATASDRRRARHAESLH